MLLRGEERMNPKRILARAIVVASIAAACGVIAYGIITEPLLLKLTGALVATLGCFAVLMWAVWESGW